MARLVPIGHHARPGARFRAAHGALSGQIRFGPDYEFTDAELEELFSDD